MLPFNDFIDANRERMGQFFKEISEKPTKINPAPVPVPDHVHFYSLAAIHDVLVKLKHKILGNLDEEVRLRPEQAHGIRARFIDVMEELGQPIPLSSPSPV